MAGYIMNLNNHSALTKCFETGTYSTKISLLENMLIKMVEFILHIGVVLKKEL
ncbi:MAG: hypothetical protein E7H39_04130 [Clostridium sp.]|jgi:hypothetical protein|nr:hypothetical protein [Clostridium sp.]